MCLKPEAVADPGFPVGGRGPVRGTRTSDTSAFCQMYAKMKELGPVGGGGGVHWAPPRSANEKIVHVQSLITCVSEVKIARYTRVQEYYSLP